MNPNSNHFVSVTRRTANKLRDETETMHPLAGPNSITHWAPPRLRAELAHIIGGLNSGDLSPSAAAEILEDILQEDVAGL